jgi:hypothetical protein
MLHQAAIAHLALAFAQPFERRSSQVQHDRLKKYYEISNFRPGGKYDLSDPSKWENGGEGGTTLGDGYGARSSSEFWSRRLVFPKSSGPVRRSISPASGKVVNSSAA